MGRETKMKINIENKVKNKKVEELKGILLNLILKTLKKHNQKFDEINIIFVNNNEIRKINKKYLSKNSTTDVISFSYADISGMKFADIFISTDTATKNASIYEINFETEIIILTLHGILHAIGFDDLSKNQRIKMSKETLKILKGE
jgi:rRNA maturation RNase YbeY